MNDDIPTFDGKTIKDSDILRAATCLLMEAGHTQYGLYKDANLSIDYKSFNKFVRGINKRTQDGREYWDWLKKHYPEALKAAIKEKEDQAVRHPLVRELNKFINGNNFSLNKKTLQRLEGSFIAYRRLFHDAEKSLMVMELTCGLDDDNSSFRLRSKFNEIGGSQVEDVTEGYILPHVVDGFTSFYGKIRDTNTACYISVNAVVSSSNPEKFNHASGAIIVSAPHRPPALSPFYMVRAYEPVIPGTISIEEFRQTNCREIVEALKL